MTRPSPRPRSVARHSKAISATSAALTVPSLVCASASRKFCAPRRFTCRFGSARRLPEGCSGGTDLPPNLACDKHPLDLTGALADLQDLRVAVEPPDWVLVHEAVAAE